VHEANIISWANNYNDYQNPLRGRPHVERLCDIREKPDKTVWKKSNTRLKTYTYTLLTNVDKVENSSTTITECLNQR
jgi:hypothetical protein